MDSDESVEERGLIELSESAWAKAKQRADVIGPLAKQQTVSMVSADAAAIELGISQRQVYELINRYRASSGLVTDMVIGQSEGGRGKARIAPEVDAVIAEVIEALYLTRQKRSEAVIVREIRMRCKKAAYKVPARNTIRARIQLLDPLVATRKRKGFDATRSLRPAAGKVPQPVGALDIVQIDHSPVDVIVVDEKQREPIGRPYLTLAIDTFTRCIVGMILTLEAPSATSVGLCLAHSVSNKSAWLASLGLSDMSWEMHGKPNLVYTDNAREFKSEALKRGCEQHGIRMDYRPIGQPHFGGIIERVIGTAMTMVHELPGTTFSNTEERGKYDSEARAILTLRELEKWLTLAIGTYHGTVHGSLLEPPAACWKKAVEGIKLFGVTSEKAFLIDFLPVIRRDIGRTGFLIDHISYYSDNLKPWISKRQRMEKFIIRRDPRDLSRVWVLDPESNRYLEIPYRSISNPAVTLWEHKKAVEKVRESGREEVDEAAIFRMVDKMREITETAAKERKRARRDSERSSHLPKNQKPIALIPPEDEPAKDQRKVKIFEVEQW
ncbi:MAG: Mu transposase C-terminal domain-containing protein [Candidatus Obscuribacterales bacterium]